MANKQLRKMIICEIFRFPFSNGGSGFPEWIEKMYKNL
ncbi:hypothetical protein T03_8412 [Trichinella britovi]|uniref:Uncharacterized protein n=1 Tax=Trichinella britovi TaxID=45882 RepID=A0A0V1AL77_TRIBR|nr:hypothetical protein T03_8412 [Trichinella britovi]